MKSFDKEVFLRDLGECDWSSLIAISDPNIICTVAHEGHGCTSKQSVLTLLNLTFFV